MKEMVGGCCVCSDERGWPDNPLVYCDGNGCTVAVHQACYGIVTVPTGPWFCRKCESPETKGKVRCELCPSKSGALKRTDTGGWAHVVCALYIPEVRFGNVTSMEPIVLRLIPPERYNKTCYICHDSGKTHRATAGACMQCNKSGCKQQFHVTCAQSLGLLCEEAGNYLDNVKYCGYCQHHYSKLKKGGNVKTIPPYKPVSHDSQSSDSSEEKEGDTSPRPSGSGTPTNTNKSKVPGRKSSHSSNVSSGKNTPNSAKAPTPTNSSQPIESNPEAESEGVTPVVGRKHKSSEKSGKAHSSDKKKASPSRRGSSADAGSKGSTPAPSPQHVTEAPGGSTPGAKATPPAESPSAKPLESVGVISSGISTPVSTVTAVPTNTGNSESPTQQSPPIVVSPGVAPTPPAAHPTVAPSARPYQESVITNTEAVDTKLTKKKRAMTSTTNTLNVRSFSPRPEFQDYNNVWALTMGEVNVDGGGNKVYKRMKLLDAQTMRNSSESPGYSPGRTQSPIRSQSPVAGPSGINTAAGRKSPVHPQHGAGRTSWGNLNVSYELQQDPNKPGVSGVVNREISLSSIPLPPMPPAMKNKKRAAMATSVGMAAPTNPSPSMMQPTSTQGLANVRRQPQSTPPLIYQETIKDSPPSSPEVPRSVAGSERGAKGKKGASNYTAPHMLGNELNPKSVSAARLQEQLSAELAAHAAGGVAEPLVPPPLVNKAAPPGTPGGTRTSSAQSLDQLLERQWEQGSQFLMEQAQHFDIASLLSCLHQLRTENVRLEDHVGSLLQRRDHLLAVNARLAIPLTTAITTGPAESVRCPRENGSQVRGPPPPMRATDTIAAERPHQLMLREGQPKPS